jgi:hypothetical protein
MKVWIRRNTRHIRQAFDDPDEYPVIIALQNAVHASATRENIAGWFHDSGYM